MIMASRQRTLVTIPAYNEEGSVGRMAEEVKKHLPHVDILVVNDHKFSSKS